MQENGYTELLGSLSIDELLRLKRVLSLVPPVGRIDLDAVVAAMRDPEAARKTAQSSSASPDFERWRSQVSGGRRFELSLRMSQEAAREQFEREWGMVQEMHAEGMSYGDAWKQIRERDIRQRSRAPEKIDATLDEKPDDDVPKRPRRKRLSRRRRQH